MPKQPDKVLRNRDDVRVAKAHEDGRKRQWRINVPGLYLIVLANGRGTYVHEYRVNEGTKRIKRKTTLGQRSRLAEELDDIKREADKLNSQVSGRRDPVGEAKRKASTITFKELADLRFDNDDSLTDETRDGYRRAFEKDVYPTMGHLHADEVTREHVMRMRKPISERHALSLADRVVRAIGGLYKWGRKHGHVTANPTEKIDPLSSTVPREVVLTDDDVRNVWRIASSDHVTVPLALAMKIALLTGMRRGEVLRTRIAQVDFENGVLRLEGAKLRKGKLVGGDTKNRKSHVVPLSHQVAALFREAIELANEKADGLADGADIVHVFPARVAGSKFAHIDPHSASKALLRNRDRFGIEEATMHDFRRTVATWLGEDEDFLVVKRVLGHVSGDVTERHYLHSSKMNAVRAALQRWADHVERVVDGRIDGAGKVVALVASR